jgi:hypothetical protein
MNEGLPAIIEHEVKGGGEPHQRQCTAKSKRSQKRCGKYAMKGQSVCRMHGGAAPLAMKKAQEAVERADMRLRGLSDKAVDKLEILIDNADSETVMLSAAKDILDRAGLKAKDRVEVDASITVTRPW